MRNFFKQIDNHFFCLFFFTSVLVAVILPYYADGSPALAFTDQQSKNSQGQKAKGERLDRRKAKGEGPKANEIVFVNRSFNDLVIDLAKAESEAIGIRQEAEDNRQKSQKPILVKLNKNGEGKFKVENSGVYEVWIKNTENLARFKDRGLEINIDGEELEGWEGREGDKWIKVGEKELGGQFNWLDWFDWLTGKHRITVTSKQIETAKGDRLKAEGKRIGEMEFVIVSKDKMKEYENLLKSKDIGYLFYVDKEKIENMLRDEERLKEIKLKKDNPFRIGEQNFYIPKDGSYSVKALIKPKRDFLESGFVSSSSNSSRASLDAVSGWDIKALNTAYKQTISDDGMRIDAYFQGKGDVKESVVLTKKFSNIDIKERPYLAFSWEMEDLGVQEAEIDIRFADSNRKMTLKTSDKQYVVNLYEKTKGERLKAEGRNLLVEEVILKFKKKDGVDVSDEKKREVYAFIFKNIVFLKHQPILAEFEDKLVAYLPDMYYYFDENGELRNADFLEQFPWDVKDVYRLHIQKFIDLMETPVLLLSFPKPTINDNISGEKRDFPDEWKVVLGLDFNGDEKEDDKIETLVPAAGISDGNLLLTIRAYEEIKKRFPNKKYNLISVGINHPDDKEMLYQNVMSKKLIRYREHIYKPSDFRVGADVLEVDGKIYKLEAKGEGQKAKGEGREAKGDRQKVKDEENNWVEFNNIQLEEGEHSLNVFENDKFKVEMVEIKPTGSTGSIGFIGSKEKQETPKIEFKKINPTRYVVDVKGAKGPFTLVFSESFHEGWKAYIRQKTKGEGQKAKGEEPWSALWSVWKDRGNRIEIKDHFVVNGYANGWIIQAGLETNGEGQKAEGEDFQIVLEYKPQRLFEIGVLISATTLIGCMGYLGYDWRRRRKS